MAETMTQERIFREIEPVAQSLYDRHMDTAGQKDWYPHELIPYDLAKTFGKGYEWDKSESPLPRAVRSALFVNLLTEDNLPYYFDDIKRMFGSEGAYGKWSGRWTAEEGRHSIAIRDYLIVTRSVDPVNLEKGRMAQVSKGKVPHPEGPLKGVLYVSLQELATRVAHFNTGTQIRPTDPAGYDVMKRVSQDENFHYLFYRDLAAAASEYDQSGFVLELKDTIETFEMPGTGIPGFGMHAATLKSWGVWDMSELSGEAEEAQAWLAEKYKGLGGSAVEGELIDA
jgi:acyl-[acyl-carrier-protein] desaturase